ncbi:MAG: 50S ribosomal protein L13 [Chlamydia sp.]
MNRENQTFLKRKEDIDRTWFVFDATGKTLGRLSSEIAKILRGKHRADFTPYVDSGDGVIVINAEKIVVTGSKNVRKIYRYYTGSMSGLREIPYETMIARHPSYPVEHAVRGMLPKSRLARAQMKRLRIFKGSEHGMDAQQPVYVTI